MCEKVKGSSSTNLYLQISHGDEDRGMKNIVHNVEITRYGTRWVPGIAR